MLSKYTSCFFGPFFGQCWPESRCHVARSKKNGGGKSPKKKLPELGEFICELIEKSPIDMCDEEVFLAVREAGYKKATRAVISQLAEECRKASISEAEEEFTAAGNADEPAAAEGKAAPPSTPHTGPEVNGTADEAAPDTDKAGKEKPAAERAKEAKAAAKKRLVARAAASRRRVGARFRRGRARVFGWVARQPGSAILAMLLLVVLLVVVFLAWPSGDGRRLAREQARLAKAEAQAERERLVRETRLKAEREEARAAVLEKSPKLRMELERIAGDRVRPKEEFLALYNEGRNAFKFSKNDALLGAYRDWTTRRQHPFTDAEVNKLRLSIAGVVQEMNRGELDPREALVEFLRFENELQIKSEAVKEANRLIDGQLSYLARRLAEIPEEELPQVTAADMIAAEAHEEEIRRAKEAQARAEMEQELQDRMRKLAADPGVYELLRGLAIPPKVTQRGPSEWTRCISEVHAACAAENLETFYRFRWEVHGGAAWKESGGYISPEDFKAAYVLGLRVAELRAQVLLARHRIPVRVVDGFPVALWQCHQAVFRFNPSAFRSQDENLKYQASLSEEIVSLRQADPTQEVQSRIALLTHQRDSLQKNLCKEDPGDKDKPKRKHYPEPRVVLADLVPR
jgi:hypothetical protein